MPKPTIQMRIDQALLERLDEVAGPRGRSAFVSAAVASALATHDRVLDRQPAHAAPQPPHNVSRETRAPARHDVTPMFKR